MHITTKRILIASLAAIGIVITLLAVWLTVLSIAFRGDTTETLLMSSQSPSGAYTVEIRKVGTPPPFGEHNVTIWIRNVDGEEKLFQKTKIKNDGSALYEGTNYSVKWVEDGAVIKLNGFEQTEETIRIKNEDFDF